MKPNEHGPWILRLILGLFLVATQVGCAGEPDLGPPPTSQAFRENAVGISLQGGLDDHWERVKAFLVGQVGELVVIDEDLYVLVARRDDLVVTVQLRMMERGVTQVLLAARMRGGYQQSASDLLKRRMIMQLGD